MSMRNFAAHCEGG